MMNDAQTQDYHPNNGIHLHFVNNSLALLGSSQVKSKFTLSQETHGILQSEVLLSGGILCCSFSL
jgi:hypothetical protein